MMRLLVRAQAAVVALSLVGCSATVHRIGQPNLEAEIHHGDSEALWVFDDSGKLHKVPGETIGEIDHPGNVLAIIGGVLLGSTLMALAASTRAEREEDSPIFVMQGSIGLGLFVGGLIPYVMSTVAAQHLGEGSQSPPEPEPWEPPPQPEPAPAPSEERL